MATAVPSAVSSTPTDFIHDEKGHEQRLKTRSLSGGVTLVGNHALRFIIQTAGTSVLARTLTPDDFGVVAMATCITGLLGIVGTQGLCTSTLQRNDITHRDLTSLFWIVVAVNAGLAVLTAVLAPLLSYLYHDARVVTVTIALSSTLVFGGLTAPQFALLLRNMRYRAIAITLTLPLFLGISVGVGLAVCGFGHWALVSMSIVQAVTSTIAVWTFSDWRPAWPTRDCDVSGMLRLGGNVTAYDFLQYLVRNADNCLVGAFLGADALGLYSKAYGLLLVPVNQINPPLNGVVLPALCRLQGSPSAFRSYYMSAFTAVTALSVPVIVLSFVEADAIIYLLLGPQWSDSATIFRILAPAAFVSTINLAPMWILTPLGRTQAQLRWACLMSPIIITGFAVGLFWGVTGVAASFSITFVVCFLVFLAAACHDSPIRFSDLVRSSVTPIGASFTAGAVCMAFQNYSGSESMLMRAFESLLFAVTYSALFLLAPGGRSHLRELCGSFAPEPC